MSHQNASTSRFRPQVVRLSLVGVVALAGAVAFFGSRAPVNAEMAMLQPAAGGIGVLDFEKLQEQSEYFKKLRGELESLAQELDGELRAEAAKIQEEARQARENLAPGSDQLRAKEEELGERQAMLQFRQQLAQRRSLDEVKAKNLEFYEQVEKATRKVASDRQLSAVLRKNMRPMPTSLEEVRRLEAADLEQRIRGQYFVYVDAGADVTGEIVQELDAATASE